MKSQALIMNVIGAILLFVGILVHIVCMATPHMAGIDYPSIKDEVNGYLTSSNQFSRTQMRIIMGIVSRTLSVEVMYGPWKMCVDFNFQMEDVCDDWEKPEEWIKATQAFSLLGVLAAIGALVVSALSLFFLFKGNWKKILPLIVCILACGAAVLIFIEAIIFAAKHASFTVDQSGLPNPPSKLADILEDASYLDWGFGLDIVAAILLIVAGFIHVLGGRAAQREGTV